VTLLIGVNNQYRGLSTTEYETEFTSLLNQAIQFAAGENRNVYVLSIPDWGVTPFAKDRNAGEIRNAIDEFNCINQTISEKQRVNYIEITEGTRRAGEDPSLLAPDGLHYSGTEHLRWAEQLVGAILRTKEGM
ncbi:MAG TPA: GDSL-type esterase/lipase family protein, partial [Parasegetibacter sp.]